jgi:hypothetical protein
LQQSHLQGVEGRDTYKYLQHLRGVRLVSRRTSAGIAAVLALLTIAPGCSRSEDRSSEEYWYLDGQGRETLLIRSCWTDRIRVEIAPFDDGRYGPYRDLATQRNGDEAGVWTAEIPEDVEHAERDHGQRYRIRVVADVDGSSTLVSAGGNADRSSIPSAPNAVTFDENVVDTRSVGCTS